MAGLYLSSKSQISKFAARGRSRCRPLLMESLEDRRVLDCSGAVCTVNVIDDMGVTGDAFTTLREAVDDPQVTEIKFSIPPNEIIVLTQGPLVVTRPLLVDGTNLGGATDLAGERSHLSSGTGDRVWNIALSRPASGERGMAVVLRDLRIEGNTMPPPGMSPGGGIDVSASTTLTLENVTISGGSVAGNGGGVTVGGDATLIVRNSTISGNTANSLGGGIANYGTLELDNSTLSGNHAELGGGVFMGSGSEGSIASSTIVNNVASVFGGGLFITGGAVVSLQNSIISGNNAPNGPDIFDGNPAGFTDAMYSLVQSPNGHHIMNGVLGNIVGVNPQLGMLADNGGPTKTHAPQPGSPVIDAGNGGRANDQRLFTGVVGTAMDMGSIEVGAMILPDGDFNSDQFINVADLDLLVAAIASGTSNPVFDLNGDAIVDNGDLDAWLALAGEHYLGAGKSFLRGDANLNGFVDGVDFIVWNANKFTSNAAWSRGDFNADGSIDGSDFIIWNANKFQSSDTSEARFPGVIDRLAIPFQYRVTVANSDDLKNNRSDTVATSRRLTAYTPIGRRASADAPKKSSHILDAKLVDAAHLSLTIGGLPRRPHLT